MFVINKYVFLKIIVLFLIKFDIIKDVFKKNIKGVNYEIQL